MSKKETAKGESKPIETPKIIKEPQAVVVKNHKTEKTPNVESKVKKK